MAVEDLWIRSDPPHCRVQGCVRLLQCDDSVFHTTSCEKLSLSLSLTAVSEVCVCGWGGGDGGGGVGEVFATLLQVFISLPNHSFLSPCFLTALWMIIHPTKR